NLHRDRTSRAPAMSGRRLALTALGLLLVAGVFLGVRYETNRTSVIDSILVVPFDSDSGNTIEAALSEGIPSDIIYRLSLVSDLHVINESIAFSYKKQPTDALRFARGLNAQAIVTGRLEQRGDDLNIRWELVDAMTGANLFVGEYRGKSSEIQALRDEMV